MLRSHFMAAMQHAISRMQTDQVQHEALRQTYTRQTYTRLHQGTGGQGPMLCTRAATGSHTSSCSCEQPEASFHTAGRCLSAQWLNCVSVTPALMMPVEEVPPETMLPISSTISEPLHFWCVRVSTPCFRSSRWMSWTYAAAPRFA
jgi:hypothetical protein